MNEPGFMEKDFPSDDAKVMKSGVEQLVEKMEILSKVCLSNKNFKPKAEERLKVLEDEQKQFVTKQEFFGEMESCEHRCMAVVRQTLALFQENLSKQEEKLNASIVGFEKKVNDHQSEVLWRIQDCEELLKNRVSEQRVRDLTNAIDEKLSLLVEKEQANLLERMTKSHNDLKMQITAAENFTAEKFDYIKTLMLQVDAKAGAMATTEMIDGLKDANKDLKLKFEMEFEQFQQYLKEQSGRFNVINTRLNGLEKANKQMKSQLDGMPAGGDEAWRSQGQSSMMDDEKTNSVFGKSGTGTMPLERRRSTVRSKKTASASGEELEKYVQEFDTRLSEVE